MSDTKFLKPAAGLKVRLEGGSRHIAEDGEDLPNTAYYRRHIRDGALVKATRPKPPKKDS